MLAGKVGVFLLIIIGIPVICAPCRHQIFTFIGINRKTKFWEHWLVTTIIYGLAITIAILVPNVIVAFSFIGGTGCVIMAFLIPLSIYVKLSKKRWY